MNKINKIIVGITMFLICVVLIIIHKKFYIKEKNNNEIEKTTENIALKKIGTYNKPIVPVGFKQVETPTASWELEDDITKGWNNGLVIEDEIGNQFVWVPVEKLLYNEKSTDTDIEFKQIYQYGGFYIGRYEAGIPDEYIERKNEKELKTTFNNKVGIPTSQKGKIPWNYINWSKADESATSMYKDNEYVMSDLITDRQWNYTANWLAECGYNVNDCATWGNYSNVNFEFTGYYSTDGKTYKYAENKMKQTYNMILSTGATERNKANNIYDLAGNLAEYVDVNEKSSNMYDRGGYYDNVSIFGVGSNAKIDISNSNDRQGFRVVLYFK